MRTFLFGTIFFLLTAGATLAGARGIGADASLHQQVGLRHVHGRAHLGGGLRGGK